MNVAMKAALAVSALGLALASTPGEAAMVPYVLSANAPAHCQAFTPGPSNTIRNRVIGSENIGAPMNVACAFETAESLNNGTNIIALNLYFSNMTASDINVNCTLLTGYQGDSGAYVVNKSATVTSGDQEEIFFDPTDNVIDPDATDLGNTLAGVNCTLPTGAVINDTYVYWGDEDGVEGLN